MLHRYWLHRVVALNVLSGYRMIHRLVILSALLACTQSASAITITVLEDSATRLDFVVRWDALGLGSNASYDNLPGCVIRAMPDFIPDYFNTGELLIIVGGTRPYLQPTSYAEINFGKRYSPPYDFSFVAPTTSIDMDTFGPAGSPVSITALINDNYGARFTYGVPVPDSGNTFAFLVGAIGILGLLFRHRG